MNFWFSSLSGTVVAIEDATLMVREESGQCKIFKLHDLEPDVALGDRVVAIFGSRFQWRERTFAGVRNLSRGSFALRKSHFAEEANTKLLWSIAGFFALLSAGYIAWFYNHVGELLSAEGVLLTLALFAGWASPVSRISRLRTEYDVALKDFVSSLNPNESNSLAPEVEFL